MHASLLRGGAPQFQRSEELRARESFVPVSFRDRAAPRRAAPRLALSLFYALFMSFPECAEHNVGLRIKMHCLCKWRSCPAVSGRIRSLPRGIIIMINKIQPTALVRSCLPPFSLSLSLSRLVP